MEIYYEAAEKAGWPDRLDRGTFKYGWDAEKRRGIITSRYSTSPARARRRQALDRAARAMELQFDYYGPFGFGAVVAPAGRADVRPQQAGHGRDVARARDRDPRLEAIVIDKIMKIKRACGYEDFCFISWFELGGFEGSEIEEQMQLFAEEVMPVLARECGGKVELPARGFDFVA